MKNVCSLKMYRSLKGLLIVSLFLFSILLINSCCEDCPICQEDTFKPYNGYLYAADILTGQVYRFTTENDSLLDSISSPWGTSYLPRQVELSPNKQYLAVSWNDSVADAGGLAIYDAQTLAPIQSENNIFKFRLLSDTLLVSLVEYGFEYYSFPGLTFKGSDTFLKDYVVGYSNYFDVDTSATLIYRGGTLSDQYGSQSAFIQILNYSTHLERSEIIPVIQDHQDFLMYSFKIVPEQNRLFLLAHFVGQDARLCAFDLQTQTYLYGYDMHSAYGTINVCPDRDELYITDPGFFGEWGNPGTVYILDITDLHYICGISL